MKQVVEDCRSGTIQVPEVPAPKARSGAGVILTRASLISAGTEGASIKFGRQNLLQKALSRPELARQVLDKVRSQGLKSTYQTVQTRLDLPLALGYSLAGDLLEVGPGCEGLRVGDRVACAGQGYASHAQLTAVPKNLMVRIPEGVAYEDAAFSTVGAIALQGLRVGQVCVGERVVVLGLGLIGLLTVQLLKAAGCLVLGADLNAARVALARELGANEATTLDPVGIAEAIDRFTHGRGANVVIITAATRSNAPIELAGEVARLRGRVVAVGDVKMDVPRRTYYEKELELRLSRSYGPGRYDPSYEEKGIDYPYAYVPFTEQRNMATFLDLVAEGKVTPTRLISHRFAIEEAEQAYGLIKGDVKEPYLGVLFTYPDAPDPRRTVPTLALGSGRPTAASDVRLGFIGAGSYARQMLLPRLKGMKDVSLVGVATSRGVNAWDAGQRYGFQYAATDPREILDDAKVNAVVIATRHNSHASLARAALEAGKHVFVEKPLATNETELRALVAAAEAANRHLMVGFNRRFAPLVQRAREAFAHRSQPLSMLYRVNAGAVPASHWMQDGAEGGGRIVGEVCHFVDLLQYLCGAPPVSVFAACAGGEMGSVPPEDVVTITLRFADGSIGTIHYFANGHRAISKEYLEIYGGGRTFILDDFRQARCATGNAISRWKSRDQDKGQQNELQAFVTALKTGGPPPIPLSESVLTTLTTFRVLDSLRRVEELPIDWD